MYISVYIYVSGRSLSGPRTRSNANWPVFDWPSALCLSMCFVALLNYTGFKASFAVTTTPRLTQYL